MKKVFLLTIMCLAMTCSFAQSGKKFAVCKVIEKKGKVEVLFSKDVTYLGTDYEKNVLYFENKRLEFSSGLDAVSYLSASWSWILCGNPTQLKKGTIMWTLKHEIDNNIANFARNMRALELGQKLYYNRNTDDMYYDYDGSESH